MDYAGRNGDWMETISGQRIYPLDLRPEDFHLDDIAHALSMMCRFNGHITRFYSVAEHSVHVSRALPDDLAMWGLLHDASEAYLADIVRPVKPYLAGYYALESQFMAAICIRFGLSGTMPAEVKRIDDALLATEAVAFKPGALAHWTLPQLPIDMELPCWSPVEARAAFVDRFVELGGRAL